MELKQILVYVKYTHLLKNLHITDFKDIQSVCDSVFAIGSPETS